MNFGIIPCFNEDALRRIWEIVNPGITELVSLGFDHLKEHDVKLDIFRGQKTLEIIYKDEGKDLKNDYIGFLITEHYPNSFHGYAVYIKPEFRNEKILTEIKNHFEETAKKWTAPYATFCTNLDAVALNAGYAKKYSFYEKKL